MFRLLFPLLLLLSCTTIDDSTPIPTEIPTSTPISILTPTITPTPTPVKYLDIMLYEAVEIAKTFDYKINQPSPSVVIFKHNLSEMLIRHNGKQITKVMTEFDASANMEEIFAIASLLTITTPSMNNMNWIWEGLLSGTYVRRIYDGVIVEARRRGSEVTITIEPQ